MMTWITATYPAWPREYPDEAELRRVAEIFRTLDPVPDSKFEAMLDRFQQILKRTSPPLLERLGMIWLKSTVPDWPENRPDPTALRDALAVIRQVVNASDEEASRFLHQIMEGSRP
jgi:hypothetical protein